MKSIKDIRDQSLICLNLMTRLDKKIRNAEKSVYTNGIEHYCQRREEIRLLRRELMELSEIIGQR